MTEHFDKPKILTTVDDTDVSADAISSLVTLRENAVDDCLLVANNEEGKNYLATLKMGSEVVVKYWWADKPEDEPYEVFRGKIIELNPSTTIAGEITSVRCYGKAICLKDMRVAAEYGSESKNSKQYEAFHGDYPVDSWVLETNQWTHVATEPWIHDNDIDNFISIACNDGNKGKVDSYYTFSGLDPKYESAVIDHCEIWVKAKIFNPTTTANLIAQIWDGTEWHSSDERTFDSTDYEEKLMLWDGESIESIIDTVEKFNGMKLRINFANYTTADGSVQVTYARVHAQGTGMWNRIDTLRKIMTDADIGIIPQWVEKMRWTESGTPIDSGYSINTDYIYDDPLLISYLYFPYMSAFDAMRDIINILSAMRYPNAGPHWIMTPDGKLLIAPIGLHQENGIPDTLWKSYARVTPLEVKKHNILENFIQEEPIANTVLVAGKFVFPQNELWTEGHKELWRIVSGYLIDDCLYHIIGSKSSLRVQGYPQSAPLWTTVLKEDLNIDVESIGTKNNVPSIEFFGKYQGDAMNAAQLIVGTGTYVDNDSYDDYYYIDIIGELGTSSWSQIISKKLGVWLNSDVWGQVGNPDWNNINYIGFRIHKTETILGGSAWLWVDKLSINGTIIRCAYNSASITKYGAKIKVVKDCLDQTDSLDATDDSSMLALVAKSELIRNQHPLLHGKVMTEMDPAIKSGQLVHVHAGRTGTTDVFQIDQDFRIVEVQHSFTIAGALTTLTLVDDLLNSISIGPIDAYNTLIQCMNPDSQTKDMASLKFTSELDPELTILAHDYAP